MTPHDDDKMMESEIFWMWSSIFGMLLEWHMPTPLLRGKRPLLLLHHSVSIRTPFEQIFFFPINTIKCHHRSVCSYLSKCDTTTTNNTHFYMHRYIHNKYSNIIDLHKNDQSIRTLDFRLFYQRRQACHWHYAVRMIW